MRPTPGESAPAATGDALSCAADHESGGARGAQRGGAIEQASVEHMRFRVVTYNMRKGKGIKRSRPALEHICRELGRLEPAVLLCQEVFHDSGSAGVSQSADMADALELLHRYEPNAAYRKGHHGNASFSSFPVVRHFNRDISTNAIERRGVLYFRLRLDHANELHVFNTHFGLSQRQRLRQAEHVGHIIRAEVPPSDPVILAGDFNDWTGQVDQRIAQAAEVENAMLALAIAERRTWSTRRPIFALDRIYYRNLHLAEVKVHRHRPWDELSDHFPVEAIFEAGER